MTGKSRENSRVGLLLDRLAARTNPDGSAKPGYTQNVASLKAALAQLQPTQGEDSGE